MYDFYFCIFYPVNRFCHQCLNAKIIILVFVLLQLNMKSVRL